MKINNQVITKGALIMNTSCKEIRLDNAPVIEMKAGGYLAIVAPTVGSNVARLRDCKNKLEILRYNKKKPITKLTANPCTYGMPTLYLPNRLKNGVLKVSDTTYQFPVNEGRFQNFIHGFLHTRNYEVVETKTEDDKAILKTRYVYDEKDLFFEYYPVKFQSDIEFILDKDGLHYSFTLTNQSDRQMPYGVCNHTSFAAPHSSKSKAKNIRLKLPAVKRLPVDFRQLPTPPYKKELSAYDENYVNGTAHMIKFPINNDMYEIDTMEVDGKQFHGALITDTATGKRICYEVDDAFKFFIVWNDRGTKDYYCPEPMSWMIDAPNLDLPAEETGYIELAPGESKTVTERIYTL